MEEIQNKIEIIKMELEANNNIIYLEKTSDGMVKVDF